ncbi:uncharacterized protein KY384_000929 [Bacidia gigantensis]|uniref:uncharacterized protein n=1 Tax=Bacidia gigantensis TaxID=2732470 RepID=UPI001D03B612|nr:uncharacterized protein KY384_000929 [Bacidia gigantensis]KAG8534086.1 hypothetical protein KY384_000929 [Bacidia gigantensis]
MTSVEKGERNTYLGAKEPKYSILTYTWGRWVDQSRNAPALPVKGTTWRIPAVKIEHFSVASFLRIVDRMGAEDVDWAWIDVACIDQENTLIKMDEIGRQASVFQNAHRVFLWLSHTSLDLLKTSFSDITRYSFELGCIGTKYGRLSLTVPELIDCLCETTNRLLNDPWFSSLWTLQELVLRNDALVLSKEGEDLFLDSEQVMSAQSLFMISLISSCQNAYSLVEGVKLDLEKIERLSVDQQMTLDQGRTIMQNIMGAGLYFLFTDNPNVQYSIAQYRRTSRPEDRVYAIMQVYNLRVGQSLRPNDAPPLHQLIDEFALAILSTDPMLGQLFLHTAQPETNKSWRLTQNSRVPPELMAYKEPSPCCQIGTILERGTAIATGEYIPFRDLLALFQQNGDTVDPDFAFQIMFDDYLVELMGLQIFPFISITQSSDPDKTWICNNKIACSERGDRNLFVLLLGDFKDGWNFREKQSDRRNLALVLLKQGFKDAEGSKDHSTFKRLGLCYWTLQVPDIREQVANLGWKHGSLELC